MTPSLRTLFRRLRRDQRGGIAVMTGIATVSMVGMAAFVVDLGNVMNAQRQLQASADAAALAGARDINCCSTGGTAITTATNYSATAGHLNAGANLTVTMASGYPQLKCFSSTGVSCSGSDAANGIVVKQKATVPLYFGPVIGINSVNISATATAGANGGAPASLDVMIILDTTASMNTADSACTVPGISHPTREDCALYGLRELLTGFWPTLDRVGLMVFPGVQNATSVALEYDCSSSPSPTIVAYKSSPVYKIIPLSTDYRSSNTATTLNTSSNMVKAARGGASGCTQGLTAVGGVGTFFADVITAAQTELTTNGRAGVQKVIIILSDGDAGASSSNMISTKYNNQCHQAITAAQTATAAGTLVYSIAYGANTSSSSSCSTDSPRISACSTMQQIASDSSKFYSDNSGGSGGCNSTNSYSHITDIFPHIGTSLTSARLMPDNTM
jgi:Flp pilus assembly protein TadG